MITLTYCFARELANNLNTTLVLRNTTLTYCFPTELARVPQNKQERACRSARKMATHVPLKDVRFSLFLQYCQMHLESRQIGRMVGGILPFTDYGFSYPANVARCLARLPGVISYTHGLIATYRVARPAPIFRINPSSLKRFRWK